MLVYVTLVSDPPGQIPSLQTLSCCCLRVGGCSVTCCSARGWPGRLSASAVWMLLLRTRSSSHPGPTSEWWCARLLGSRAHCLVGFAQERWARQPVGSLGMPRLHEQPPGQTALWPSGERHPVFLRESFVPLRVGETQVHPLGAAGSPIRCAHTLPVRRLLLAVW